MGWKNCQVARDLFSYRPDMYYNKAEKKNVSFYSYGVIILSVMIICSWDRLFPDGNYAEKTIFDSLNSEHWSMSLLFFWNISSTVPKPSKVFLTKSCCGLLNQNLRFGMGWVGSVGQFRFYEFLETDYFLMAIMQRKQYLILWTMNTEVWAFCFLK